MTTATLIELPIEDRIQNAVAIFKKQDVAIAVMKSECLSLKIDGVDDKEGYTKVYESRQTAKRLRIAVGKKAKAMKEDALRDGKALAAAITEEDKRITAELETIETYLQKQEDGYEAAREKIKADKAAAAELILQTRVKRLTEARCQLPELAFLRDVDADNFELYFAKAVEVQVEKDRLAKIESDRIAAEQAIIQAEQTRLEAAAKAERERVAAERQEDLNRQAEANQIEAARLLAEREATLHNQAVERAALESERAELKRQADELRAKQAESLKAETLKQMEENKRLAEIARAELVAAEAARLEALKPEIEKAESFAKLLRSNAADMIIGLGQPWWSPHAMREIEAACNQIKMIVSGQ